MKKIFSLLFFFLICIPVIVRAEPIEVPKPSRPGRITIPETISIGSTLRDVDDEIARVATIANATQLTVQNQFGSLNPSNNASFQNFPAWPVALGPTLEEALLYQNIPSLTSIIYPPQFLMASSPSLTSIIPSDEIVRLAHFGGGQGAAGGSFFGPNLLPPLGLPFGQGPVAAPFPGPSLYPPVPVPFPFQGPSLYRPTTAPFPILGPSFYQPAIAPLPNALLYQSGPIPPYAGVPNGQLGVSGPLYPFPPTPFPLLRGPGWYPPNPSLLTPQRNLFSVPPPRSFW